MMEAYFSREPDAGTRAEMLLSTILATYVNAHTKEGQPKRASDDYRPWLKSWENEEPQQKTGRYSQTDMEYLRALH